MAASTPIRNVAVVGGTHGNEYTGVWVIKALQRRIERSGLAGSLYPSYKLDTLLGNPEAFMANRRFIHADLNRQFSLEAVKHHHQLQNTVAESKRALEIYDTLGPKFGDLSLQDPTAKLTPGDLSNEKKPNQDLIIDLHTTTANMGTTIIVANGDPFTCQAAAYVWKKLNPTCFSQEEKAECRRLAILIHTHTSQALRPHLSSIAPHCLTIEAGPVPQGVLRHDIVENTQRVLDAVLEFVHRHNTEPEQLRQELDEYYKTNVVDPDDDVVVPKGLLPCYVSAPALRKGEMSAKLSWPSDPENPNFPAWMVHKSIQDKDFCMLHKGDPLFVDLDGNVIPYDGSHGSPVRLMFVNEGGYYYASSGTGVSVARKRFFNWKTGALVEEEEDATD
eukprot:Nitzschia sp. Nitz4//scaffold108_size72880//54373//55542//NITZ4_005825-RA/size72880-processed-gene-0.59-mRNA-1//-1//CDS//3329532699//2728//frame0